MTTKIAKTVNAKGQVPIGATILGTSQYVPEGFLVENGAELAVEDFPELYAAIGEIYGSTIPTVTFKLPDSRGQFPRFTAYGSANDPDRNARTNRGDGTTGDAVGTKQSYQLQSHTHSIYGGNVGGGNSFIRANGFVFLTGGTNATGGNETRPININKVALIRAF